VDKIKFGGIDMGDDHGGEMKRINQILKITL